MNDRWIKPVRECTNEELNEWSEWYAGHAIRSLSCCFNGMSEKAWLRAQELAREIYARQLESEIAWYRNNGYPGLPYPLEDLISHLQNRVDVVRNGTKDKNILPSA